MRIIISPAKQMGEGRDFLAPAGRPVYEARAGELAAYLRSLPYEALKELLACGEKLARAAYETYQAMDFSQADTPALLAYRGIQYQYMAPGVFSDREWDYVQAHLRILSGFYGLLRPLDGVVPYRLEMQARLTGPGWKDLYGFWGRKLSAALAAETEVVVDLASREYSRAVLPGLPPQVRAVTCVFGRLREGRVVEQGTACKMARGEMVRWMAEHRVTELEELPSFGRLGYRFDPERSGPARYVFIQEGPQGAEGSGKDGMF